MTMLFKRTEYNPVAVSVMHFRGAKKNKFAFLAK